MTAGRAVHERAQPHLRFLGHAGFELRYGDVTLLCDPWLSPGGAFLRSWHQFPPNDFIDWYELYRADFLYISHDHQDHFDREFLSTFPKHHVTVLVADYVSDTLFEKLADLGFPRVVKLSDWAPYELGDGFTVQVVKDASLYKTDSFLIARCGSWTILNKNDCHIPAELFPRLHATGIDLLLAQFSGAMWHPFVYGYEREKERDIAAKIKQDAADAFVRLANSIGARHATHCAGPPCFLEDGTFHLNDEANGIFPDQQDVYAELSNRLHGDLHLLMPGDDMLLADDRSIAVERVLPFDFSQKFEALAAYRDRRASTISDYLDRLARPSADFLAEFTQHLRALFSASPFLLARVNALVKFDLTGEGGGSVYVDTRSGSCVITQTSYDRPNYTFTLDAAIARLLVEGVEMWEDVLLSMRFSARCEPDMYNWPLFAILRYGADARLIAEVERTMRRGEDQTTTVMDGERAVRIQRFCPHAGEDLTHGKVINGKLICPRHGWTFDLRNHGVCIRGGNLPIRIEEPDLVGTGS